GTDSELGGSGADRFNEDAAANGNDTLNGGAGLDLVDWSQRTNAINATLAGATADDGESGEGDKLVGVEKVNGGHGDDTMVGATTNDTLAGNDCLYNLDGGSGND